MKKGENYLSKHKINKIRLNIVTKQKESEVLIINMCKISLHEHLHISRQCRIVTSQNNNCVCSKPEGR